MRIQVKGRSGFSVDDELRSRVEKKLGKVERQVSRLAELDLSRQVKKHRDKRRGRRVAHRAAQERAA